MRTYEYVDPEMGHITEFREDEPFEVDGITYYPPPMGSVAPMFSLRHPEARPIWVEIRDRVDKPLNVEPLRVHN